MTNITISPITDHQLERICREHERKSITGLSKAQWYRLEREGRAPRRFPITERTVGWKLSDLTRWVQCTIDGQPWREPERDHEHESESTTA